MIKPAARKQQPGAPYNADSNRARLIRIESKLTRLMKFLNMPDDGRSAFKEDSPRKETTT